jgi:hypothetical protein
MRLLSNRVSGNFVGNTDCKVSAEAGFILDETPAKATELRKNVNETICISVQNIVGST